MSADPQLEQAVRSAHRGARRVPYRTEAQVRKLIRDAWRAHKHAEDVRARLRRASDPDNADRIEVLERERARLTEVMAPMRSELSRIWHTQALEDAYGRELREASDAVKRERRKLWKMLHPIRQSQTTGE